MSVDKYINTQEKGLDKQNNAGIKVKKSVVSFELLAADGVDSVYRLFKNINANNRLLSITILCDALTTLTDADLGYYNIESGAVVDVDELMDGQDLSSASRVIDGMSAVAIENIGKRHYELLGLTQDTTKDSYDICLTINTAATVDGTITVIMEQASI